MEDGFSLYTHYYLDFGTQEKKPKKRKPNGYKFGNSKETISSALSKNKRDGTLSRTGKLLAWILDKIDKNHVLKSINNF